MIGVYIPFGGTVLGGNGLIFQKIGAWGADRTPLPWGVWEGNAGGSTGVGRGCGRKHRGVRGRMM